MALFGILRPAAGPTPALPSPRAWGAPATLPGVSTGKPAVAAPKKPWEQPGLERAPAGLGVDPKAKKPSVRGQIANFVSRADDKDWDLPRRLRAAPIASMKRRAKKQGWKMPKVSGGYAPELSAYLKAAREPWGLAKRELSEAEIEQRRLAARERWARYRRGVENTAIGTAAGGVYGGLLGAMFHGSGRTPPGKFIGRAAAAGAGLTGLGMAGRYIQRELSGDPDFRGAKLSEDEAAAVVQAHGAKRGRERMVRVNSDGRVAMDILGGRWGVGAFSPVANMRGDAKGPTFHNHPFPAAPSGTDFLFTAGQQGEHFVVQPDGERIGYRWSGGVYGPQGFHQDVHDMVNLSTWAAGEDRGGPNLVALPSLDLATPEQLDSYSRRWGATMMHLKDRGLIQVRQVKAGKGRSVLDVDPVHAAALRAHLGLDKLAKFDISRRAAVVGGLASSLLSSLGRRAAPRVARRKLSTDLFGGNSKLRGQMTRRHLLGAGVGLGLQKFDPAQHPRAEDGRFTEKGGGRSRMAGGAPRPRMVAGIYSRGPQWEERAPKTRDPAMRVGPTKDMDYRHRKAYARFRDDLARNPPPAPAAAEDAAREAPDVSALAEGKRFKRFVQRPQKPSTMSEAKYVEMGRWANERLRGMRDEIIERSIGRNDPGGHKHALMIPRDADPKDPVIRAAFNHAKNLALHDVGLIHYDFEMQPEHIEALTPYKAFIKHARRKMGDVLRSERPGEWAEFRREFGEEFDDGRTYAFDTRGQKAGEKKKRFLRHQVLLKSESGRQLSEAEIEQRREAAKARWRRATKELHDLEHPYFGGRSVLSDKTVARLKSEGRWAPAHEKNQQHARALRGYDKARDAERNAWIAENQHRSTAATPMQRRKILAAMFEREVPPPPAPKGAFAQIPQHVQEQGSQIRRKIDELVPIMKPLPPQAGPEVEAKSHRLFGPYTTQPYTAGVEAAEEAKYQAWKEGVQRQATDRETGARLAREGKRRAKLARRMGAAFGVAPKPLMAGALPKRLGGGRLKGIAAGVAAGAVLGAAGYGAYQHYRKGVGAGDLEKVGFGALSGLAQRAMGYARPAMNSAMEYGRSTWKHAMRRRAGAPWSSDMKGYRHRLGDARGDRMAQIRQAQDRFDAKTALPADGVSMPPKPSTWGAESRFHAGAQESSRALHASRPKLRRPETALASWKKTPFGAKLAFGGLAAGAGGLAYSGYQPLRRRTA